METSELTLSKTAAISNFNQIKHLKETKRIRVSFPLKSEFVLTVYQI